MRQCRPNDVAFHRIERPHVGVANGNVGALITRDRHKRTLVGLLLPVTGKRAASDVGKKVRSNRTTHPLFDRARFAKHLETAIEMMWQRSVFGGQGRITVQPEASNVS